MTEQVETIETDDGEQEPLPPIRHPQLGDPARVYRYVDAAGDLAFVVCRFEPGQRRDDGTLEKKTFRQARLDKGRWTWNLEGVERILYQLPRIITALAAGERVWIVEGEKDADRLTQHGVAATCNPMGAGPGKFTEQMAETLQGCRAVTVVVDEDDEGKRGDDGYTPGERHAAAIVQKLLRISAVASVDIDVVHAAEGKDASDHLDAGHGLDDFVRHERVQATPPAPPASTNGARPGEVRVFNRTDLGNAERLVAEHGDDLRYVPQLGWHVWDGARWRPDTDGEAHRRAKHVAREIARDGFENHDGDTRKKMLEWGFRSEARPRLEAMVALAQTDSTVVVGVGDLDADRYQLNTRSGTVDLATGNLREHNRADHISKLCPVDYQPAAAAPTWDAFLETTFAGDRELIGFLQRAIGYSLTGSTEEQVLFLLHGRGENGKSTFVDTIQELLGDYAQTAPADLLMQSRTSRGGATPDLARLPGARFVSAIETGQGRRIDEPLVKQLTGGDRISARRLYKEPFEFTPTHKLWLATNHLPEIAGTDHAIWRRVRLIPFNVTIGPQQRDLKLKEKLFAELPGILNWALVGCLAWMVEGLQTPASVQEATDAYRADMDELGAFIDECCAVDDHEAAKASTLLTLYGYWAAANNASPITPHHLARALVERGFRKTKRSDGAYYHGIGIPQTDLLNPN